MYIIFSSYGIMTCALGLFLFHEYIVRIFIQCRGAPKAALALVCSSVVSASDVTPTDRWLNVWCIWNTKVETLQEFRSRHRIGWIIRDFRETCVKEERSLTFRLETKMLWRQTLSRKKKAVVFTTVTTSTYQDQLNTGFSKVCQIFKFHGIESLKCVWEFYTPVCYCYFHAP